jgi:hypothetical protein
VEFFTNIDPGDFSAGALVAIAVMLIFTGRLVTRRQLNESLEREKKAMELLEECVTRRKTGTQEEDPT